jgi:uncharacterized protein involved in exopolysaccharide biosynthesis
MSTHLDSVTLPLERGSAGLGQILPAVLAVVWRRKGLVLCFAAASLALAVAIATSMPVHYTSQAYIRGEFVASDTLPMQVNNMNTGAVSAAPMSLDPVRIIETQSRLLQSARLARRVAEQIGLDRLQPILNKPNWLPSLSTSRVTQMTENERLDLATGRLLGGLTVTTDPRAYLITLRYRAADPELAVLIANAFVAELLRSARLQVLYQERYLASATLSNRLARYGEKHPRVAELMTRLAATNASLDQQLAESPDSILQSAGENVTKATVSLASPTPTFLAALTLLFGIMLGVCAALWFERHKWWPA